jgi:hypothetical protein
LAGEAKTSVETLRVFCFRSPLRRRLAHWLFLLVPTTIFFSGVYTESLFSLLSLVTLYAARRNRRLIASLIGFLAGATRVVGWTLIVPLLWEAWEQCRRSTTPAIARGVAALAPALALPIYAGAIGLARRSPTAYFDISQAQWGQGLGVPWRAFTDFFNGPITLFGWTRSLVDLIFTLAFLALAIQAFRIRIGYGLYLLAGILFPAASGTLSSMPRYVAVLFPAYLVLAQWMDGHRWQTIGVLAISALLAAFFAARFVTWHWIA